VAWRSSWTDQTGVAADAQNATTPEWALARDLYLVKNIFPEAVAEKAAREGILLPD